jgi:hypothetical protein
VIFLEFFSVRGQSTFTRRRWGAQDEGCRTEVVSPLAGSYELAVVQTRMFIIDSKNERHHFTHDENLTRKSAALI